MTDVRKWVKLVDTPDLERLIAWGECAWAEGKALDEDDDLLLPLHAALSERSNLNSKETA